MTSTTDAPSASFDVAAACGWLAALGSTLFAPVIGVVPFVLCLFLGVMFLLRARTRSIGKWMAAGVLCGVTALAVCWALFAISGPLFPE
jgi:hypothetical protein